MYTSRTINNEYAVCKKLQISFLNATTIRRTKNEFSDFITMPHYGHIPETKTKEKMLRFNTSEIPRVKNTLFKIKQYGHILHTMLCMQCKRP